LRCQANPSSLSSPFRSPGRHPILFVATSGRRAGRYRDHDCGESVEREGKWHAPSPNPNPGPLGAAAGVGAGGVRGASRRRDCDWKGGCASRRSETTTG
jgi:hypothetical protein